MAGRVNPFDWRMIFLAGNTAPPSEDVVAAKREMTELCGETAALIKRCADQKLGDYGRLIAAVDALQGMKDTFEQALGASS